MRFSLKAMDTQRQVIGVELEAADEARARELARDRGYVVLSIAPRGALAWSALGRHRAFPTTLFAIELLALLEAGLNVVEALHALADKESEGESRRILGELVECLHRGESLSRGVERFPEAFPALFSATLRSSERTGNVQEALVRYIAYAEELDKVRKKIVAALLYPVILLVVGAAVMAFLLFYVVPRFARVYDELATDLPFFSALLLALGGWIERHGAAMLLGLAALAAVAAYAATRPSVRAAAVERLWRIPAIGERMRVYQLGRFYRTVGMLLRAGIPVLRSFEMVGGLLALHLRAQLARGTTLVREGAPMSAALASVGLTTPVALRMLLVGERSGRMGEMMDRIARFHDEESARFIDAFARVFEPLLMAGLGIAVGLVVVLMYMPVFELAGNIR